MAAPYSLDLIVPEPPCDECRGSCCQGLGGEPYATLLHDDEAGRFPEAVWHEDDGLMVIPYDARRRCIFLTADGRCGIYERRPRECRGFNCLKLDQINGQPGQLGSFFDVEARDRVFALILAKYPCRAPKE